MRIGSITWSELSSAFGRKATFSVAAGAWKVAGASSKDRTFTGLESAGRNEEDQFELL